MSYAEHTDGRHPDGRCPDCAASVPRGAEWCSLCFRDLRPAPASPTADVAAADLVRAPAVPGESQEPQPSLAPQSRAVLAAAEVGLRAAAEGTLFGTPQARVGVMVCGTVAVMALFLALMWLFGSLL